MRHGCRRPCGFYSWSSCSVRESSAHTSGVSVAMCPFYCVACCKIRIGVGGSRPQDWPPPRVMDSLFTAAGEIWPSRRARWNGDGPGAMLSVPQQQPRGEGAGVAGRALVPHALPPPTPRLSSGWRRRRARQRAPEAVHSAIFQPRVGRIRGAGAGCRIAVPRHAFDGARRLRSH